MQNLGSQVEIKDYLKDFFNERHNENFQKKKHRDLADSDAKNFLLCLDNIEKLATSSDEERTEFKKFIAEILDYCPNLSIIVTSLYSLQDLPNNL